MQTGHAKWCLRLALDTIWSLRNSMMSMACARFYARSPAHVCCTNPIMPLGVVGTGHRGQVQVWEYMNNRIRIPRNHRNSHLISSDGTL